VKLTDIAVVVVASVATFVVGLAAQQPAPGDMLATSQTPLFQGDATRDDAPRLTKPVVVQSTQPQYTPEALRAKVHGSVDVQVVVGADGSVVRARPVKVEWAGEGYDTTPFTEATPGLLANALTAAKVWKFRPGTLNGAPVPVLTTITLTFRIH
jgi:outer membrane biosynthesis protein TonB